LKADALKPLVGKDKAERMIAAARGVVWWERVWPALWPGLGLLGLYAVLALSGVFAIIPAVLHLVILAILFSVAGYFFWRDLSLVRQPSWDDGARRVERDSHLANRPLSEGGDTIAAGEGDALSEGLWRLHIARLLASAKSLRLAPPKSYVAARDPYYLRYALLAALVLGFAWAGTDSAERLSAGLSPNLSSGADRAVLNAWLTPPSYTGLPPQSLTVGVRADSVIHAPIGSVLTLRLRGSDGKPWLRLAPAARGQKPAFEAVGGDYEARATLSANSHVSVRLGMHSYADWKIDLIPDLAPNVSFVENPSATVQQAVKFAYRASDDYGVVKMQARIVPDDPAAGANAEPLMVDLPVPAGSGVPEMAYRDLTPHPYSGLRVKITLIATDGAGQTGISQPATMVLPQRIFTKPLAQALVEQRRNLAVAGIPAVPPVREAVDALTVAPDKFYKDDYGTYLSLRALVAELGNVREKDDVNRAMAFLWDIALGIEEGDLSLAAEQLRDAQQQLMQALEKGASDEEIQALMQKMKQALANYLQAMAQSGQSPKGPPPADAKQVTEQDLQDMLAAIQDLSRTGARDQARQLLSQLNEMLENLRNGRTAQGDQNSAQQKATNEALQNLSDLMAQQRDLLDKTFRAQQGPQGKGQGAQGQSGMPHQADQAQLSKEQRELREKLDNLLSALAQNAIAAPKGLGSASSAMGQSTDDLDKGSLDQSAQDQQEALKSMSQGAQALAQSQMAGTGNSGTTDSETDPLGRSSGATGFGGAVKLPEQSQLARAREILNELRRRAAERSRPQQELDYLDRLLKRF
jgi:uncharacterized protein (TIGR02302 family)